LTENERDRERERWRGVERQRGERQGEKSELKTGRESMGNPD